MLVENDRIDPTRKDSVGMTALEECLVHDRRECLDIMLNRDTFKRALKRQTILDDSSKVCSRLHTLSRNRDISRMIQKSKLYTIWQSGLSDDSDAAAIYEDSESSADVSDLFPIKEDGELYDAYSLEADEDGRVQRYPHEFEAIEVRISRPEETHDCTTCPEETHECTTSPDEQVLDMNVPTSEVPVKRGKRFTKRKSKSRTARAETAKPYKSQSAGGRVRQIIDNLRPRRSLRVEKKSMGSQNKTGATSDMTTSTNTDYEAHKLPACTVTQGVMDRKENSYGSTRI